MEDLVLCESVLRSINKYKYFLLFLLFIKSLKIILGNSLLFTPWSCHSHARSFHHIRKQLVFNVERFHHLQCLLVLSFLCKGAHTVALWHSDTDRQLLELTVVLPGKFNINRGEGHVFATIRLFVVTVTNHAQEFALHELLQFYFPESVLMDVWHCLSVH